MQRFLTTTLVTGRGRPTLASLTPAAWGQAAWGQVRSCLVITERGWEAGPVFRGVSVFL